jgi:hypothetical protein
LPSISCCREAGFHGKLETGQHIAAVNNAIDVQYNWLLAGSIYLNRFVIGVKEPNSSTCLNLVDNPLPYVEIGICRGKLLR